MYSEDINRRKLQKCSLKILSEIDKICSDNGLQYFLCGGSLLGAIRHKGFIPWDDDIDIWMPRRDYDKFINIVKNQTDERYGIIYYKDCIYPEKPQTSHAQMVDRSTSLIRECSANKREINVWVDIFPLDGMPKGKIRRILHYYHFFFWYVIMQISWFDNVVNLSKFNRPYYERIVIKFIQKTKLGNNWNTEKIIDRIEKIIRKYAFNESNYVASFYGSYRKKEILPSAWFERNILVEFENYHFIAPENFHDILSHYYNNYMVPPQNKEEKEEHHKITIISVDN